MGMENPKELKNKVLSGGPDNPETHAPSLVCGYLYHRAPLSLECGVNCRPLLASGSLQSCQVLVEIVYISMIALLHQIVDSFAGLAQGVKTIDVAVLIDDHVPTYI